MPTENCGNTGVGLASASTYPPNEAMIATTQNGFSAQGLTSREINTAALCQSKAQKLVFTGARTFSQDVNTPVVYGWTFSGSPKMQTVILNLSSLTVTLDLSGIITTSSTVRQLSAADPGTYVTGGPDPIDPVDFAGVNSSNVSQPVTLKQGPFGTSPFVATNFTLKPFSITRITAQ